MNPNANSNPNANACPLCEFLVQKAVDLMFLVPKRCNDMMNLGRLQGYEVR